ncbi:uncharacterized protein LOC121386533 [Gigantopelta aegis]|uniref:uncharacterized protein LOC121386533 n=1 Tax=Gigantopelta aegis TaxID=1735272 RepID=UPI001B88BA26|nr:uncharacterized protein LOC121386533 [Gigantopelta aegis]
MLVFTNWEYRVGSFPALSDHCSSVSTTGFGGCVGGPGLAGWSPGDAIAFRLATAIDRAWDSTAALFRGGGGITGVPEAEFSGVLDTTLRATVTGKADNNDKQGCFIQVVLRPISCRDSGQYFCKTNYLTVDLDPGISEDSRNITVHSPVSVFVRPRKEADPYFVNETVEFRCTGDVGNPSQSRPWLWQWKLVSGMMDLWTSYPYNDRIHDDPVTPGNCLNQGRSTLRHVVSVDDNGRMFRCLVNNNELYSANFTIYIESEYETNLT